MLVSWDAKRSNLWNIFKLIFIYLVSIGFHINHSWTLFDKRLKILLYFWVYSFVESYLTDLTLEFSSLIILQFFYKPGVWCSEGIFKMLLFNIHVIILVVFFITLVDNLFLYLLPPLILSCEGSPTLCKLHLHHSSNNLE